MRERSRLISPASRLRIADLQEALAARMGLTQPMAYDVQREVKWWVWGRVHAALNRRPLRQAWGIGWTHAGYGELLPLDVPRAGRGRVSVVLQASVISPGTERAQYLRLPNTSRGLGPAGYSGAGVVLEGGPGTALRPGERVAVAGAPHASIVTVPAASAYQLPPDISTRDAALIQLGVICGGGLTASRLRPGEEFCVIGSGPIGTLCQRLASAAGAVPLAFVARSRARESLARGGGVERFLLVDEDRDAIAALRAPVVIDASGDPEAVHTAVLAAGERARIILLGSPRGTTANFPLEQVRAKRLEIVGAHVRMLKEEQKRSGIDAQRREGERFVDALSGGRIEVADLLGEAVDPREAALFYRRLASEPSLVAAHFDWTRLPHETPRRRSLLAPPRLAGRGTDFQRRPLKPAGAKLASSAPAPFDGARGNLRVALLGCGDIGVNNATALAVAPNAELVACFDPSARLSTSVARRFGAEVAPTAEALLARTDVDAALLAVPHHLHAPLALQAAEAGKHVIVEKPLADTLAAAMQIAAATEAAGVVLSVCFPYRYEPAVQVARSLIESGALGRFSGSHTRLFSDNSPVYWAGGYSGRSHSDWRSSKAKAGGGVLIMNLSHYIDLVRYLTGVEALEVSAVMKASDHEDSVETAVTVGVRYEGGATGSVVGGTDMRGILSRELRLWGSDGHLAIEPEPRIYTQRAIDGLRPGRWHSFGRLPGSALTRATYFSRLASALDAREPPEVTAGDGLAVQSFIEAAYRSSELGEPVRTTSLLEQVLA